MSESTAFSLDIDAGEGAQASTLRVRDIIDAARTRHWSFADTKLGDGALVLYLNTRQLAHLAAHGPAIEALVGATYEVPLVAQAGRLVALIDGVPTFTDTYEDGWATHVDEDGVPYSDFTEPKIAGDPFGTNGGVAGIPLPTDMVRLIAVTVVWGTEGRVLPVDVIPEREAPTHRPSRDMAAFISGNRLVPSFPLASSSASTGDRWFAATALRVSYIPDQFFGTLDDVVMLPAVLCDALIADLCVLLANQSKTCPPVDKRAFREEADAAYAKVRGFSNDMLDSVQSNRVIHRR